MLDSDRRGIGLRSCWNPPRWRAFGAAWFSSTCWVCRGGTRLCLLGRRLRFTSKCFINIRPKTTLGLKHRYPFNYFQMIKLPHSPSLSPFWSVWRWNYRSHREIRVTFWKSQSFNIWRRILMLFMPIFHSSGCFASIKYKKRVVF